MERAAQVLTLTSNDTREEIFPSFLPNIEQKPHVKRMDIISNLEDVKNLEFDSEYITDMIEKFSVTPILCNKCNDLSKHFMSPEFYTNELYIQNARWVPKKEAIVSMNMFPYNKLTTPVFDIANINILHPNERPMGKIHLVREASELKDKQSFINAARNSSLSALKRLKDKPYMSQELEYKLAQDVDSGVLMKLEEFLKLDEVKEKGIDKYNAHELVCPSPIHIVCNPVSKSSPVRLVVAPNRVNKNTRQSINSALHAGLPQLPKVQEILLKYRLSLSLVVADLCAFYKRNVMDPHGSLLSAVYLQSSTDSKYPKLGQTNDQLSLWVMRCANFGYSDSASLSCTAKNLMPKFYKQHFPSGIHKLTDRDLEKVKPVLENSYSDDVLCAAYISDVKAEN